MRVEMHSGYKADEYPVRFWVGGQRLEVMEIEDRWYSPGHSHFKVFADDARHYLLTRDLDQNDWDILAMENGE